MNLNEEVQGEDVILRRSLAIPSDFEKIIAST
jgi:hypothetical protein